MKVKEGHVPVASLGASESVCQPLVIFTMAGPQYTYIRASPSKEALEGESYTNQNLTLGSVWHGPDAASLREINTYYCKPLRFGEYWVHSIIAAIAYKCSH